MTTPLKTFPSKKSVRKQVEKLVSLHRGAHAQQGRALRAFILFGPLAENQDYHEVDILEIVDDWPPGETGAKLTAELMRNLNFSLPGRLYLRIINPAEACYLAERLHPIIQSVADGYQICFDREDFAKNLMADVVKRLNREDAMFAKALIKEHH